MSGYGDVRDCTAAVMSMRPDDGGDVVRRRREKLERSLALAEQAGLEEHVGRAYIHFAWAMTRIRAYELEPLLDRGVKVCQDLGLKPGALYVIAYRAGLHLDRGRWNEAATDATTVLTDVSSVPL